MAGNASEVPGTSTRAPREARSETSSAPAQATTGTAGFQAVQISPGFFVVIFCEGPTVFGPCTIVPGSSYDQATGEFTMVGDDTLDHPDITDPRFARYFASNTFRLREAPFGVPSLRSEGILGLVAALVVSARLSRAVRSRRRWRLPTDDFEVPWQGKHSRRSSSFSLSSGWRRLELRPCDS